MTTEELAAIRELLKRPITSMERKDIIAVGNACEALLAEVDALRGRLACVHGLSVQLEALRKDNERLREAITATMVARDRAQSLLEEKGMENERLRAIAHSANLLSDEALTENELLRATLRNLLDRNVTYFDNEARLPFESHDQAINHIGEARRAALKDQP